MSQALKTYSKGAPFYNVWNRGHLNAKSGRTRHILMVRTRQTGDQRDNFKKTRHVSDRARHSFTGEGVLDQTSPEAGLHPQSEFRSWQATLGFLAEVLK